MFYLPKILLRRLKVKNCYDRPQNRKFKYVQNTCNGFNMINLGPENSNNCRIKSSFRIVFK